MATVDLQEHKKQIQAYSSEERSHYVTYAGVLHRVLEGACKTAFPEVYRVPKLGGQKAEYLVAAMKAYKKGERDFATMRAMVADLSDKDMADIAAYYAAQAVTTAEKKK